jgi:hypothetical protein
MLRQDDYLRSQLVTIGYQWGLPYGGHLAACMIMSVIAGRVRNGWGTWLECIDRIPTFSAQVEMPTGIPTIWDPAFVRLLVEVDAIFDSSMDHSKGALYWADLTKVDNPWFIEKIIGDPENHPRIGNMNSLTLFK